MRGRWDGKDRKVIMRLSADRRHYLDKLARDSAQVITGN
jgi:hypothetical protein